MTPAVLWVLLVFVYLPTPHWGVASIEFPYSDTSGGRAPMVSTFASRNECLAGRKDVKEALESGVSSGHKNSRAVFGVDRNKVFDVNPENGDRTLRPDIWRHEPKCVRFLRARRDLGGSGGDRGDEDNETEQKGGVDRACIREQSKTFDVAAAKRICDPKNYVKPNQLGWLCEPGSDGHKIIKGKGGARRKRDAICE